MDIFSALEVVDITQRYSWLSHISGLARASEREREKAPFFEGLAPCAESWNWNRNPRGNSILNRWGWQYSCCEKNLWNRGVFSAELRTRTIYIHELQSFDSFFFTSKLDLKMNNRLRISHQKNERTRYIKQAIHILCTTTHETRHELHHPGAKLPEQWSLILHAG